VIKDEFYEQEYIEDYQMLVVFLLKHEKENNIRLSDRMRNNFIKPLE